MKIESLPTQKTSTKLLSRLTLGIVSKYTLQSKQSIAKFDIKTGVVVYKLVKQLSLIIVADLHY
jgi:hypothetical protein